MAGVEERIDEGAPELVAELYLVAIELPREVVDEMPVGVYTGPWHGESCSKRGNRRTEVRIISDSNKRQPEILRALDASVQTNRTRVEAAVFREEAFVETVIAKTRFINFLRRDHLHVRKRDQVDRSWSDRVEAGENVAGKNRQRERLIAVSVIVAAGELIALAERVIDLRDQAVHVVKRRSRHEQVW